MWGATLTLSKALDSSLVSIHAPRVGCDYAWIPKSALTQGFNSRTPCGVRQTIVGAMLEKDSFNSRTPCGVRLVQ